MQYNNVPWNGLSVGDSGKSYIASLRINDRISSGYVIRSLRLFLGTTHFLLENRKGIKDWVSEKDLINLETEHQRSIDEQRTVAWKTSRRLEKIEPMTSPAATSYEEETNNADKIFDLIKRRADAKKNIARIEALREKFIRESDEFV